jgi:hypothetical protein
MAAILFDRLKNVINNAELVIPVDDLYAQCKSKNMYNVTYTEFSLNSVHTYCAKLSNAGYIEKESDGKYRKLANIPKYIKPLHL